MKEEGANRYGLSNIDALKSALPYWDDKIFPIHLLTKVGIGACKGKVLKMLSILSVYLNGYLSADYIHSKMVN